MRIQIISFSQSPSYFLSRVSKFFARAYVLNDSKYSPNSVCSNFFLNVNLFVNVVPKM